MVGDDTSFAKKRDQFVPGRVLAHARDDHTSITEARGMEGDVTRRAARPPPIWKHVPERLANGYDRLGHGQPPRICLHSLFTTT